MATVNFYLGKRLDKRTGKPIIKNLPIILAFNFGGHRIGLSTGERVDIDKWDSKKQSVKAGVAGRGEINDLLASQHEKILRIYRDARITGIIPTPDYIKEKFSTKEAVKKPTSIQFFKVWNEFLGIKQKTTSNGYYRHLNALGNRLKEFVEVSKSKAEFDAIDILWIENFKAHRVVAGASHNTVSANVRKLKSFLIYATQNGYNKNLKFKEVKLSWKECEIYFLLWDELMAVYSTPMPNITLSQARDAWCFACFTGMRFSDIKALRKNCVQGDFVKFNTIKTKQMVNSTVPLNDYAKAILSKYIEMPDSMALPVFSNQKMNQYIKEIAQIAGIDTPTLTVKYIGNERIEETLPKYQLLSTHTGRKTFITNALDKGMQTEVVMSITGHKSYASLQRYFKVVDEAKLREMKKYFNGSSGRQLETGTVDEK